MQSDLVKCILQGGWMVAAVKHGLPRTVLNNSPYYITTNNLPTFGKEEDENVQRRIEVFRTKSLPQTLPGIDRWIYDHAMDCIAWIASEIDKYRDQIDPNELWYEPNNLGQLTMLPNEGQSLFSEEQIRGISTDLQNDDTNAPRHSTQTIHENFAVEFALRRLARKRRLTRGQVESDEERTTCSSDDNKYNDDGQMQATEELNDSRSDGSENEGFDDDKQSSQQTGAACDDASAVDQVPERLLEEEPPKSQAEEAIDSYTRRTYSPPAGWILNDVTYMSKVACLIKNTFQKDLQKGDLYTFRERRFRGKLKRNKEEREFWTKADPTIDAWMLLTGRKRDVFDVSSFVQQHRDILPELKKSAQCRQRPYSAKSLSSHKGTK